MNNTTALLSNTSTKYQFVILNQSIARNYEELTYSYFRWILQFFTVEAPIVAIGVELEQEPIGLILARYNQFPEEDKLYGEILSWFVVPDYRCQGIGKSCLLVWNKSYKTWL
ncbi:MAG: GNAT family N-acetyltransferase [Pseudanabaena sp. CRU_2_10]|nr:GNAT family N-acetyltransferase [Pseudanabaena sp. CRU_2_10]